MGRKALGEEEWPRREEQSSETSVAGDAAASGEGRVGCLRIEGRRSVKPDTAAAAVGDVEKDE